MITQVAVQVQIGAPSEVEVTPALVVLDVRHDVSGRKQADLFFRLRRDREGSIVDRHLLDNRFFDDRKRVHLAGILYGRVVLAFECHFPVQVFFLRLVFLCTGAS